MTVQREQMDLEARRNLHALDAIAHNERVTQRSLADQLGMALGLTNIYLKRLVRKGYVKCVNVQSNRLRYLLTPKGIREKTRLTYQFMEYSLFLYSRVRSQLRGRLEPFALAGRRRMAIYGRGEAAELALVSITELGLELVAIFDSAGGEHFLGQSVRRVETHADVLFDVLLVAVLDRPDQVVAQLVALGIERDRIVTLCPE